MALGSSLTGDYYGLLETLLNRHSCLRDMHTPSAGLPVKTEKIIFEDNRDSKMGPTMVAAITVLAAAAAGTRPAAGFGPDQRPNLVFALTDDLGYLLEMAWGREIQQIQKLHHWCL